MKIIKSLEESGLLTNISETIEIEVREPKADFLGMLAATLGASLLGNVGR